MYMPSRMDKYNEENLDNTTITRSQKNEDLYRDIYTNRRYTEIGNLEKDNVVDISDSFNRKSMTRSDFQRKRVLYEDGFIGNDTELTEFKPTALEEKEKFRSYNVNDILEEARKNRTVDSEEEKKRKIKNVEYSILSDLSQEKLREYSEQKDKPLSKDEEENLEGLIHTITSNSLKKKIDDGLLTDLMPMTEEEPVISSEFLESLDLNQKMDDTKELTLETTLDDSFYTRSMDLKKEDIISTQELNKIDEEVDESFKEDKIALWKVVITILSVVVIIGLVIYLITRFI